MSVTFHTYNPYPLFGEDYCKLRNFLIELNDFNYPFGRWDWMITHSHLDKSGLPKIGIWEDGGKIVAIATYDTMFDGKCFFPFKKGYEHLLRDMVLYAKNNLSKDGKTRLLIKDGDGVFQSAASDMGFIPTRDKDYDAVFLLATGNLNYTLPDGFRITSIKETTDYYKYGQVLWKGFNHEANGEGAYSPTEEYLEELRLSFERPNVNLDLKIAVVAPNGDFVSYCGMWQDAASPIALVEPVATDPAFRKMGLGRAAVLEAVKRCGQLGAKQAFVDSSQQFYYSIGFRPYATSTFWEEKSLG